MRQGATVPVAKKVQREELTRKASTGQVIDLARERARRRGVRSPELAALRLQADQWAERAQGARDPGERAEALAMARVLSAAWIAARDGDRAALEELHKVARPQLRAKNRDPLPERSAELDRLLAFFQSQIRLKLPPEVIALNAVTSIVATGELAASMKARGLDDPEDLDFSGEPIATWRTKLTRHYQKLSAIDEHDPEIWLSWALNVLGFAKPERDRLLSFRRKHRKKRD